MLDPRKIDPELRKKYDVRGPRYTSYPPATHFHPVSTADVFKRWEERNGLAADSGLSLYLHIPFCRTRCLFCGCHSVITRDAEKVEKYVDALLSEMRLASGHVSTKRAVVQVMLGGGTPNYLSEAQLDRLLSGMENTWAVSGGAERSVEIDPRTVTPGKLDVFLRHGFNRFSLGVQDFDPKVLSLVRRGQDLMQVDEVVNYLRSRGCNAINFDLIYGLPGQDLRTIAATAEHVVRIKPSRIALYSYAHVPWIKPQQKVLDKAGLPDADLKLALFLAMLDRLQEAGYLSIGMDHFALPDDELARALKEHTLRRNFMGYTTHRGTDLLAFGASAISSIGSCYSQDDKDVEVYLDAIGKGELPIERGFLMSADDEIRRELLLDLFCNFTVDLGALGARFGMNAGEYFSQNLLRLAPLEEDGLVSVTPQKITVSETGRFFIRNVCMVFDKYLERDDNARMYSRTV
ncbi:MAG: oxygen-independent coproporphyrinogen III oxidase [Nanoarchaeota archaeon]|nr:oxygen-independent coproporphyrinogen III oxidase [Nanoarchaeota archaeon]